MNWGLLGLRVGSGVGFFAGILVLSNFSILIAFALAVNLSIIVVPVALLFRSRRLVRVGTRNLLKMGRGFSAGVILFFVVGLYYFWTGFLAVVAFAVANTVHALIGEWSARSQLSVEIRRLTRNLLIMVGVMAPLLFFAALVIKGLLAIVGWGIAYVAFSSVIILKYVEARRQSRKAP